MATRPPRGQQAAKTAPVAVPVTSPVAPKNDAPMPAAWGSEPIETFNGHDLTEKKELVGVPFLVIGAEIERNENRGYDVAYVYALDINGTEFEFSDSSTTGVRTQVQGLLADAGKDPAPGAGFQTLRVAIMKGLRVSPFKFTDPETGKTRNVETFYLSASGGRTEAEKPAETPAATA